MAKALPRSLPLLRQHADLNSSMTGNTETYFNVAQFAYPDLVCEIKFCRSFDKGFYLVTRVVKRLAAVTEFFFVPSACKALVQQLSSCGSTYYLSGPSGRIVRVASATVA
jgi:hypothetical protein